MQKIIPNQIISSLKLQISCLTTILTAAWSALYFVICLKTNKQKAELMQWQTTGWEEASYVHGRFDLHMLGSLQTAEQFMSQPTLSRQDSESFLLNYWLHVLHPFSIWGCYVRDLSHTVCSPRKSGVHISTPATPSIFPYLCSKLQFPWWNNSEEVENKTLMQVTPF